MPSLPARFKSWVSSLFRKEALFDTWGDADNAWSAHGLGLFSNWSLERAAGLYERSILIYAATETICRTLADIPLEMNVRARNGSRRKWETEPDDPMQELLDYPHPDLSAVAWRWMAGQHVALRGRALVRPARDTTGKVQYLMLLPDHYDPVIGKAGLLKHWRGWGNNKLLLPGEVAAAFLPHPIHPHNGMSPVQPAFTDAQADRTIGALALKLAETGGVPRGFITSDYITNPDRATEVRKIWVEAEKEAAKLQMPGLPRFLGGESKWIPVSYTAQEAEWIRSRENYRVLVAIAFGFLAAMWDSKSATYSNLRNAKEHLLKNVVLPWLKLLVGALNMVLISPDERMSRRIWFQTGHIPELRGDLKAASLTMQNFVGCGVPPNQLIRGLHLPFDEFDGGDKSYMGRGLVPLDQMLLEK